MEWLSMDTAPKDGTQILAWCKEPPFGAHENCGGMHPRQSLCLFHAHADGMGSAGDGLVIVVWGGGWWDSDEDGGAGLPDWWFRDGSEFEEAAFPVAWMPVPEFRPEQMEMV